MLQSRPRMPGKRGRAKPVKPLPPSMSPGNANAGGVGEDVPRAWDVLRAPPSAEQEPSAARHYGNTALLTLPAGEPGREGLGPEAKAWAARLEPGLAYIAAHPEIRSVRLLGADALALPAPLLRHVLGRLRRLGHVRAVRLHSEMPASRPRTLCCDAGRLGAIRACAAPGFRIFVLAQLAHPDQLTTDAIRSIAALQRSGAAVASLIPLLPGVNDDAALLERLMLEGMEHNVVPYGLYLRHPNLEKVAAALPLHAVYRLAEEARARMIGPGKQIRLLLGGKEGEIELLAIADGHAYLNYMAPLPGTETRFAIRRCPEGAFWFEDLPESPSGDKEERQPAQDLPLDTDWPTRGPVRIIGD
ncbi:hypothetical protein IDH44_01145 [Paenibacillus sp. IB182496]|uniref:Uncharacterized protein n=1 Tax=Paenibacillus sabuli TaxID=2772509 RepID=A0A927GQH9_9BACL|nr:hypothetical protein [Paenibacillus sabuli]MBD2843782.1 hypothetical protein [Paenibacillus sabuli]